MKALSVRQPYATTIVTGSKTVEHRTWKTSYRGPLLICASLTWADGDYDIPKEALKAFPQGVAVGIVNLSDIEPFREEHLGGALMGKDDFLPGFAWLLTEPRKIEPFPVRGRLHLFEVSFKGESLH